MTDDIATTIISSRLPHFPPYGTSVSCSAIMLVGAREEWGNPERDIAVS